MAKTSEAPKRLGSSRGQAKVKTVKKETLNKKVPLVKSQKTEKLAVIKVGGKQYKVREGQEILVEKQVKKEGETINFLETLLVYDKNIKLGNPFIKEAKVEGKIVSQEKGPKVTIFKMKSKKRYRVKTGHRQKLTKVKIEKISL